MSQKTRNEMQDKLQNKIDIVIQTLPDYINDYATYLIQTKALGTVYEYLINVKYFLTFMYGDTKPLWDISLSDIDNLNADDFDTYTDEFSRNHSVATTKRSLIALRNFIRYMNSQGLTNNKEIFDISVPKNPEPDGEHLSNDDVKHLISTIMTADNISAKEKDYHKLQQTRDLALISLLLTTDITLTECVSLDLTDFNIQTGSLLIAKSDHDERITVTGKTYTYMVNYIHDRTNLSCDALFVSSQGTRLARKTIQNLIVKYGNRAFPDKKVTYATLKSEIHII